MFQLNLADVRWFGKRRFSQEGDQKGLSLSGTTPIQEGRDVTAKSHVRIRVPKFFFFFF